MPRFVYPCRLCRDADLGSSDVSLERGATKGRDLFDWFLDVATTARGLGLTDVGYQRGVDIVQQDRDGTTRLAPSTLRCPGPPDHRRLWPKR